MKIPLIDLYAQYKTIKKEVDFVIKDVIRTSAFIGGKYIKELEERIAKYCGTKYAVALNSGTDALYLSLWSLGIGKGDEIITTPFTFFATAEVIARIGATPVFVDIDPQTFNINPDLIEEKITKKTKAIIPVHLFGLPADMDKINQIARKYKLFVIEDACQAIGAEYRRKKVGNIGDIGCFSFFPSKNLGCWGDGGMVTTNNQKIAEKIRLLRNHGSKIKYFNEIIGVSSRLDNLQAAILTVKLKYLDRWNKIRQKIAASYNHLFKDFSWLSLPINNFGHDYFHVYHQYTIRVKNSQRDTLQVYLARQGIATMIYYPVPLHLLKAMKYLNYKKGDLPEAEKATQEVLSLPIYPEIKEDQLRYIVEKIKSFK